MTKATTGDNSDLQLSFDEVQDLLSDLSNKQKAVSESTGSLRNAIKTGLEQTNIHPAALAMIRKIDAMSASKREDFMRSFRPMFSVMSENKWKPEQADLLDAIDGEGDE